MREDWWERNRTATFLTFLRKAFQKSRLTAPPRCSSVLDSWQLHNRELGGTYMDVRTTQLSPRHDVIYSCKKYYPTEKEIVHQLLTLPTAPCHLLADPSWLSPILLIKQALGGRRTWNPNIWMLHSRPWWSQWWSCKGKGLKSLAGQGSVLMQCPTCTPLLPWVCCESTKDLRLKRSLCSLPQILHSYLLREYWWHHGVSWRAKL